MESLSRLRRRELVLCLGSAFAIGMSGGAIADAAARRVDVTHPLGGGPRASAAHPLLQIAGIGTRAPANPATTIVTNCNDSGAGSLRAAVAGAASGDLIDLGTLACSTITLTSGAIAVVVAGLTLSGPADGILTIDGGETDRVLDHTLAYDTLTVQNLTLTHGGAVDKGGCIYSSGNLVLRSSQVTACSAYALNGPGRGGTIPGLGGAIYTRGNLELLSSTVSDSHADSDRGLGSGGGVLVYGTLTTHLSSISANTAGVVQGSYGGGVRAKRAYIDSSIIDNNYAHVGGGIQVYGLSNGSFHVTNSTIANNSAYRVGGLGTSGDGDFEVSSSTIAFNCAASTHGPLVGPQYAYGIGLHSLMSNSTTLRSSIVADNTICGAPHAGRTPRDIPYDFTSAFGVIHAKRNLVVISNVVLPPDTLQVDPMLAALADNGGPTRTLALLPGSPAIDAGTNADYGFLYDQRGSGFARSVGSDADIGAFETQSTGVTHTVSSCADAGPGSLRDMVAGSLSGDAIDLSHLACATITLTSGAIEIPIGNLALVGPGAAALAIDGNQQDRLIEHSGYGTLHVSGLTLQDGTWYQPSATAKGGCIISSTSLDMSNAVITRCQAIGENGYGGAIYANRLSIRDSTISASGVNGSHTQAGKGGGIYVASKLQMDTCVVDGNTAPSNLPVAVGQGGGLYAGYGASVSISSSTISANQAAAGAAAVMLKSVIRMVDSTVSGNSGAVDGALLIGSGSVIGSTIAQNTCTYQTYQTSCGLISLGRTDLESSLVFGNTTNGVPYDVGGTGRVIGANNLVGSAPVLLPPDTLHDDPLLGPLQHNGGATPTHALPPYSPAVDRGNNVLDRDNDQRGSGFARVVGATADIGAFEVQSSNDVIFRNGFEPD